MSSSGLRTMVIIARREFLATLYGIGIYTTVFISLVISSALVQNYLQAVERDQMLLTARPFGRILYIATVVCSVYVALSSVISIARDKDTQTLEVLFYGPVSHSMYILGKCAKGVLSYLLILLFLSAYFLLASLSTNLGLSMRFIGFIVFSLLLSTSVIAFGILVSTLTDTVRGAVLAFVVIIGGLLAIQFSHEALMEMDESSMAPQLSYLRDTLSTVRSVVKWISPFYYIHKGMEAVSLGSASKYLFSATSSLLYSGLALALSIGTLKGKGVRKTKGE